MALLQIDRGMKQQTQFLGKLGLLQAGVANGSPLALVLVAGSVVTSLLTLYAIGRVWNLAFWSAPRTEPATEDGAAVGRVLPRLMVGATLALVVLGTGLTVVAGPLSDLTARAAVELRDRAPYVRAVLAKERP